MIDHFFAGFDGGRPGKLDGRAFTVPTGSDCWIMAKAYATRRDRSSQIATRLKEGCGAGPAVTLVERVRSAIMG